MNVLKSYEDLIRQRSMDQQKIEKTIGTQVTELRKRYKGILDGLKREHRSVSSMMQYSGATDELKEFIKYDQKKYNEQEMKEWKRRLQLEEDHIMTEVASTIEMPSDLMKTTVNYICEDVDKMPKNLEVIDLNHDVYPIYDGLTTNLEEVFPTEDFDMPDDNFNMPPGEEPLFNAVQIVPTISLSEIQTIPPFSLPQMPIEDEEEFQAAINEWKESLLSAFLQNNNHTSEHTNNNNTN
jgi:hypothetical protein